MSDSQRRRATRPRDESDDDYGEGPSTQRVKTEEPSTNWDEEALQRKIKDTVRYALACEYKHAPIRREDINKKILQEKTRMFNRVHSGAQAKLRHLFGMEMVELPTREKALAAGTRKVNRESSKANQATRSYMLCNILEQSYFDPEVIFRKDDEYENIGVLYVILALIFANEQVLADAHLYQHLDRLKVLDESATFGDREKLLDSFVKQGYLLRVKVGEDSSNQEGVWEYYWGPRARAEVPESGIVDFIASFYDNTTNADQLRTYIYKAAGYDLR